MIAATVTELPLLLEAVTADPFIHGSGAPPVRELDHRVSEGLDVRLLWRPATGGVFVAVVDARLGQAFTFDVAPGDEMRAFDHPFAYAARTG